MELDSNLMTIRISLLGIVGWSLPLMRSLVNNQNEVQVKGQVLPEGLTNVGEMIITRNLNLFCFYYKT